MPFVNDSDSIDEKPWIASLSRSIVGLLEEFNIDSI